MFACCEKIIFHWSAFHTVSQKKRMLKKINLGGCCSLFWCTLFYVLLSFTMDWDFCLWFGFLTSPWQFYGSYLCISRQENVKKSELCSHTKEWSDSLRRFCKMTDRPREVCTRSVTRVEVAGQTQLRANMAYLNSSSQTTWSENEEMSGSADLADKWHS